MAEPTVETKERKRQFNSRDFDQIAEHVQEELDRRKKERRDLEKDWKEIDRQLRMECDASYKRGEDGNFLPGTAWRTELEPPLQAQTLEILTADARRMMFPETGPWFRAHVPMSDDYLRSFEGGAVRIAGDENDMPSRGNQDNIDRLVEGMVGHIHRQGDFTAQWDQVNAGSFAYGTGVGRVRLVKKAVFIETARGVARQETLLPIFFARSIKDTYLDDTPARVMNEGHIVGPAVIHCKKQKLADLVLAARDGSSDPSNENGGWMPKKLEGIEGDTTGHVDVIEWEGDLIVPRKTVDNIFVPGAIVTVVKGEKGSPKVIRLRFRKKPFSSYVTAPYHIESLGSPYGVGPLMKGRPLQEAAGAAFNRLIDAAILLTEPPIQYDRDDPEFSGANGPVVEPRALWATTGDVKPVEIGDLSALMQAYMVMVAHYADVTGMHAPRLGQQTVSHTTAFAKEAELSRGQVRTVDYASSALQGPVARVLDMQFSYLKETWGRERTIWIPDYGGFVTVAKNGVPEEAVFEVFGAAGPAERRAQISEQIQGLQLVGAMEAAKQQLGQGPPLDWTAMQKQILSKIGFADVDAVFAAAPQGEAVPPQGGPGVPGASTGSSGVQIAALQALANGG